MERIGDFGESLLHNRIYVNQSSSHMKNSQVVFQGTNNILFVEDGVTICESELFFRGSNSVVYLSRSTDPLYLSLIVGQDGAVYIGRNNYFNGPIHLLAAEWQNIIIGAGGAFSFGVWVRTADSHLIYSADTKARINDSKSVLIGDHVWIGQNALIMKGTHIGSGAIIGGGAVVANKRIPSNTAYAGNPAKQVRSGVFWKGPCTHTWSKQDTENGKKLSDTAAGSWIYTDSLDNVDLIEINRGIQRQGDAASRLAEIKRTLLRCQAKDRFYLGKEQNP